MASLALKKEASAKEKLASKAAADKLREETKAGKASDAAKQRQQKTASDAIQLAQLARQKLQVAMLRSDFLVACRHQFMRT